MHLHAPDIADGELPVVMNPGSGKPFGIVHFGTGWHTAEVVIHTDEDADRIIRAMVKTKAMRAQIGKPHAFTSSADYGPQGGHCDLCGLLGDSADHAEPAPSGEGGVLFPAVSLAEIDAFNDGIVAGMRERAEGDADLAAMSGYCPAETIDEDDERVALYCDREAGHAGSHHAPGPDEGSEVAWSDEPAQDETPAEFCTSVLPLRNGGEIKCMRDEGHHGAHEALDGKLRWLGHGADARDENGDKIAPASVTA